MCSKRLQTPIIQTPEKSRLQTALPLTSLHEGLSTRFSCCASWTLRRCRAGESGVCGRVFPWFIGSFVRVAHFFVSLLVSAHVWTWQLSLIFDIVSSLP